MKICKTCKIEKAHNEFTAYKKSKDGLQYSCRDCCSERAAAWRQQNKDRDQKNRKIWKEKNPTYHKKFSLLRKYGITLEQFSELLVSQHECCGICGVHKSKLKRDLVVDHDHETNEIRGLLCNDCNIGIGKLGDTLRNLERAVLYLQNVKIVTKNLNQDL